MQSIYLDTIIATVLVVLLFSILAYAIQEWLASVRQLRGKMLEKAVFDALNDQLNKGYGVLLFEHPQVDLLKKDQNSLPAYMPSANFAIALIDLIARESTVVSYKANPVTNLLEEVMVDFSADPLENFKAGVEQLNHSDLKVLLKSFLLNSPTYKDLQQTIETWFNQYMDRVSGWYRKKTSFTVGLIAVLLVLAFNFDALFLIQQVYTDSALRNRLVAGAEKMVTDSQAYEYIKGPKVEMQLAASDSAYREKAKITDKSKQDSLLRASQNDRAKILDAAATRAQQQIKGNVALIQELNLPIGWKFDKKGLHLPPSFNTKERPWWSILLGWILAAILISFGAPFWFNLLIKIVPLRKTGVKPKDETSQS